LRLLAATLLLSACGTEPAVEITHTIDDLVPRTNKPFQDNPGNFHFVVIADRTGGHRPGVFEQAMDKVNLLQPEFVMSVGDLIEGYTNDEAVLNTEWDELDAMVDKLDMPFFYTVGNHDISNNVMHELWRRRNGRDYYHFIYKDVLFLSLNTEDPPIALSPRELEGQNRLLEMMAKDPEGTQKMLLERSKPRLKDGPKPQPSEVAIGEQQLRYVEKVLQDNTDVRWTIVFMHKPAWETDNEQFQQIEKSLADRPYTVIAGHEHYYIYTSRFGRDYMDLATTGGIWINQGPGNMDHVTWVTMTDEGPVFANIKLDGLMDKYGPQ
jgi:hypothetical protein